MKKNNFRYCQLVSEWLLQLYDLLLGPEKLTARGFAAGTLAYHVLSQIFEQRKRENSAVRPLFYVARKSVRARDMRVCKMRSREQ